MSLKFLPSEDYKKGKEGWARWWESCKKVPEHRVRCRTDENTSQTSLIDVWSLVHVFFGCVYSIPLFFGVGLLPCFFITLTLSIGWEMFENLKCVRICLQTFDKTYTDGDNFWNSVMDVIFCMLGYVIILQFI